MLIAKLERRTMQKFEVIKARAKVLSEYQLSQTMEAAPGKQGFAEWEQQQQAQKQ